MTNLILILLLNWGPGHFYCESHPSDTTCAQTEYVPIEVASFSTVCKSADVITLDVKLDPTTNPATTPRVMTRFTIEPCIQAGIRRNYQNLATPRPLNREPGFHRKTKARCPN